MTTLNLIWLCITVVLAFGISFFMIPAIIYIAGHRNLSDKPDSLRKIHTTEVPTLGGIALFVAIMVPFASGGFSVDSIFFGHLVSASLILFTVGLFDDLIGISALNKLFAQLVATALIVFGVGLSLPLSAVFPFDVPSWFGYPLAVLAMIIIINGFNFIDGSDGLAASVGIWVSLVLGFLFFQSGQLWESVFLWVITAALAGFLVYNRPKARIFMGDTGSLITGFFLALMAVWFIHQYDAHSEFYDDRFQPVLIAGIFIIPLYDFFRIILIRFSKGKSPLESDREHIHHHLLDFGFSGWHVIGFVTVVQMIITTALFFLSSFLSAWLSLFVIILLSVCLLPTNGWKRNLYQRLRS